MKKGIDESRSNYIYQKHLGGSGMLIPKGWIIIARSNLVQFDSMGYPLRLFIIEEKKKRLFGKTRTETRQEWIDVNDYDESKDMICEWSYWTSFMNKNDIE